MQIVQSQKLFGAVSAQDFRVLIRAVHSVVSSFFPNRSKLNEGNASVLC
jgi:hypothetical protein